MPHSDITEYNLLDLRYNFVTYLSSGNNSLSKVTIKNYSSDLSHFFGWFLHHTNPPPTTYDKQVSAQNFCAHFTKELVDQYKNHLVDSHIPIRTVNRRLSALRKFAQFCRHHSLIEIDPTEYITNVSTGPLATTRIVSLFDTTTALLDEFIHDTHVSPDTTAHIQDFLREMSPITHTQTHT